MSNNTVVDTSSAADTPVTLVAPKYDDPYEENPLIAKCLYNGVDQKSAEVTSSDAVTASVACDSVVSEVSIEQGNILTAVTEQKSECKAELTSCSAAPPTRSFELSAEYGGFFVVPAVTEQPSNKLAQDYSDVQAAAAHPTRVDASVGSAGLYDEPWDLSTVKRSIEEQFSQKDTVGRAAVDSCRPPSTDVYAQPQKGGKQQYRIAIDPRVTDGPSYGVLCERPSDNGFVAPPPLARREAGTRNNQRRTWTTDSRPLDDYDVPWDQKKKFGGQTGKKQQTMYNPLNP